MLITDQISVPMRDKLVKSIRIRPALILFSILFIISSWTALVNHSRANEKRLRLAFYNLENLFDTLDGKLLDQEFIPDSPRRWNSYRYFRKLDNIAKVILAMSDPYPPAIVGLCEVENESVLNDLVNKTILSGSGYKYLCAETKDERGIRVALLYNDRVEIIDTGFIYPVGYTGDTLSTRISMAASLVTMKDTLTVVVVHWPSRRGGVAASSADRDLVSLRLKEWVEQQPETRKLILMGDYNCNPESSHLREVLGVSAAGNVTSNSRLLDISSSVSKNAIGSYKYQGSWELFDQIIISKSLYDTERGLKYSGNSFSVLDNRLLLTEDRTYRGMKPFATWTGPQYSGGFSDHLPVYIDLE